MRTGGHGPPKDGPLGRHKVHHAVGEAGRLEDLEDEIVGEDGGVAGLPQRHIALRKKCNTLLTWN